jgi:hypothetical protein
MGILNHRKEEEAFERGFELALKFAFDVAEAERHWCMSGPATDANLAGVDTAARIGKVIRQVSKAGAA